jgi:hypothetical protein
MPGTLGCNPIAPQRGIRVFSDIRTACDAERRYLMLISGAVCMLSGTVPRPVFAFPAPVDGFGLALLFGKRIDQ